MIFKVQIVGAYLDIKLFESSIVNALTNNQHEDLKNALLQARGNPDGLQVRDLITYGAMVGTYIRVPLMILMFVLAGVIYKGNAANVFRNTYSMKSLAEREYHNWPQISPVIGLDLVKTDIDSGPWAMAMSPMQFCKRYNLLQEVRPQRVEGMRRSEWDRIDVVLKRGETNRLFIMQLGGLWRGPDKLPQYARALFAAFAARVNADPNGSKLLLQMAATCKSRMNFAGADALLKKHYDSKFVQKIVKSHAYTLTVMAAMLEGSRDDGVQAAADFLWLKPVDRRLWYTLNTVGRQTPFIEVAGVFAHWVAEKEAGKKLIMPMVEEATNAVELALKEIIYRRDEE
jgi:intracellular multiplication protein IcmP